MKKVLLAIPLLLITVLVQAQENKTQFGLKTGLNMSVFSASVNSEASMKAGFHLGAYVKTPLGEKVFFRPELYYSGQGQKDDYLIGSGQSLGETTTSLNYLNLPFLIEAGRKVSFQGGPQIGFLLSGKEKGTIDGEKIDEDLKDAFKTIDFSLVLGIGFSPSQHVNFGARLNLGLNDIFGADEDVNIPGLQFPAVKNRVLHFFIGYSF